MKKTFSFAILALISLSFLSAQSGGGTNFDRRAERFEARVEQFAERLETRAETTASRWEKRADRFAEQVENRWEGDWSVRLDGFGCNLAATVCPEVSFLGIESHEVSIEKAKKLGFENSFGSYVSKVMAKSAGESAGLRAFDYIYGVDEQRTSDNQSLSEILEDYEPGNEVTLHLMRKGQKMVVKVKLTETNYDDEGDEDSRPFLGVSPAENDSDEELDGVEVDIVEKSTAEEMGLQVGDVITSINGYPVLDWDDVTTAIQNTKPGEAIEVNFKREEKDLSAKGKIKAYEEVYPDGEQGSWNLDVDWDETGNVTTTLGDGWQDEEQDENRAFMGVYTDMISMEKAKKLGFENPYGTYLTGVIPGSGAEKAGLKPFDYIYGFDEYRAGEQQNLGVVLKKYKPGEKATVHFIRKGKKSSAALTFTKPFKAEKQETTSCDDAFFGIIQLNNGEVEGVAVSPVKNSTATELGMQNGDVITHINGHQIVDWQDVTTAIGLMKPGEAIHVDYLRGGKTMKASKPIMSYAEAKNCPNCDCGDNDMVVIAKTPSSSLWPGWGNDDKASSPRMNIKDAKVELGNVSSDEASSLQSKGVQFSESSSLNVENLRLTPSATTGMFILDFNLPTSGNTVVRIYNPAGRALYEYDLGSFSGKFSDSVDISQNGPGSYFLEIKQGGKVFTKKIALSKG